MSIKEYLYDGANFQLSQTGESNYVLKLVDPDTKLNEKEILKLIKSMLGSDANIRIEFTEYLTTQGGKVRNVVNLQKQHI